MNRKYCSSWNNHNLTSAFLPGVKLSGLVGFGRFALVRMGDDKGV